jgi:hypothetical protein
MVAGGKRREHSGMKCDSYRGILCKVSTVETRPKIDRIVDGARWMAGATTTRTGKES